MIAFLFSRRVQRREDGGVVPGACGGKGLIERVDRAQWRLVAHGLKHQDRVNAVLPAEDQEGVEEFRLYGNLAVAYGGSS